MFESEFEENQFALRQEKLRQIAALGQEQGLTYAEATYPNSYRDDGDHSGAAQAVHRPGRRDDRGGVRSEAGGSGDRRAGDADPRAG